MANFWVFLFALSTQALRRSSLRRVPDTALSVASRGYFGLPDVPRVERFDDFVPDAAAQSFGAQVATVERSYEEKVLQLKSGMKTQLMTALDHLAEPEVDAVLALVWSSNDHDITKVRLRLIELTSMAEKAEKAAFSSQGSGKFEYWIDEMRAIRSRIRTQCSTYAIRKRLQRRGAADVWSRIGKAIENVRGLFGHGQDGAAEQQRTAH